jgi:hypothetical protein
VSLHGAVSRLRREIATEMSDVEIAAAGSRMIPPAVSDWRAGQNKTTNTYVIEISI